MVNKLLVLPQVKMYNSESKRTESKMDVKSNYEIEWNTPNTELEFNMVKGFNFLHQHYLGRS